MASIGKDHYSGYKFHNRKEYVKSDKFYPTPDYIIAIQCIEKLYKKIKSISYIFKPVDYDFLSSRYHPRIEEINQSQFRILYESYNKVEFQFGSAYYLLKQQKGNLILHYKEIPQVNNKPKDPESEQVSWNTFYVVSSSSWDEVVISIEYSKITSAYQATQIAQTLTDKLNKILGESLPINDAVEFFQV